MKLLLNLNGNRIIPLSMTMTFLIGYLKRFLVEHWKWKAVVWRSKCWISQWNSFHWLRILCIFNFIHQIVNITCCHCIERTTLMKWTTILLEEASTFVGFFHYYIHLGLSCRMSDLTFINIIPTSSHKSKSMAKQLRITQLIVLLFVIATNLLLSLIRLVC